MGNAERGMTGGRADYIIQTIAVLFFTLTLFLIGAFGWVTAQAKPLLVSPWWYLLFIVLAAGLGGSLMRSVRLAGKEVIPKEVRAILEEAIKNSKSPIDAYVKLSGLIGATAVFRKLEFTGMPLATILMTIVLCLLSIGSYLLNGYGQTGQPEMIPKEVATGFFDLAKLTLGAFIGSFVTKGRASEEAPPS
jgi:hypothetical protein